MLDPFQVLAELVDRYEEDEFVGPGLLVQLRAALGDPKYNSDQNTGVSGGKPRSRPPGWREDASELLADIRWGVDEHWTKAGLTPPRAVGIGLRLILDQTRNPEQAEEDVFEWRRLARLTLGFQVPSVGLPDRICQQIRFNPSRGGRYDVGCGQATLRIAEDMASDVWCSNVLCHDPEPLRYCEPVTDEAGALAGWSCRRTQRDLRHNIRWTREQIAAMSVGDAA